MISALSYALLKMAEIAPNGLFLSGDDQTRASTLAKQGLLEQKFKQRDDHGSWSYAYFLNPLGKDVILAFEKERAQDKANEEEKEINVRREKKDARRSWVQWVLNILFSLLFVILGAFLSTETHWLDWLPAIWKRFL